MNYTIKIKEIKEYANLGAFSYIVKGVFIKNVKVIEKIGSGEINGIKYQKYLITDDSGDTCVAVINNIDFPPYNISTFEEKEKIMNSGKELCMYGIISYQSNRDRFKKNKEIAISPYTIYNIESLKELSLYEKGSKFLSALPI